MHSYRALLRQLGRALAPPPCLGSPARGAAVVLPLAGGLRRLAPRRAAAPPRVAPATASAEEAVVGGQYPFGEVEERWQRYWEMHATFRTPDAVDTSKPKFYALDMFPYPRYGERRLRGLACSPGLTRCHVQRSWPARGPPRGLHGN